jgi:predicted metal-dependent peptidase
MDELKFEIVQLQNALARKIVDLSRNEICVSLRFLDYAMNKLRTRPDFNIPSIQTDGRMVVYNPDFLIKQYKKSRFLCNRAQIHMLMHCIFKHPLEGIRRQQEVWDLACDIAIEYVLDDIPSDVIVYDIDKPKKEAVYAAFADLKYKNAESIYHKLLSDEELFKLAAEAYDLFYLDNHEYWYKINKSKGGMDDDEKERINTKEEFDVDDELRDEDDEDNLDEAQKSTMLDEDPDQSSEQDEEQGDLKQIDEERFSEEQLEEMRKEWEEISEQIEVDLELFSKEMGEESEELVKILQIHNRKKYDYRKFLRKFAVLQEEQQINDEEFDYIYYTFGLNMYKNMPLVEPLEYKEINKVREFVIAIDTSGSTSNTLVHKFLDYTYSILFSTEAFASKVKIHIIQCDAEIKRDDVVTNKQEMEELLEEFAMYGSGGTDFRPVFEYVDNLVEEKAFDNLKGLIYFTDGFGVFPDRAPHYDTAFVFVEESAVNVSVPPWAIKLILTPDEIEALGYH